MKSQKKYRAFTLFEIIVSIIVLGVIATAFPAILQTVTQSAKTVTKEEIVLNEMSLMSLILTYYFDENNTIGDNFYKDLNASKGDEELLINSYSPYTNDARIGKAEFNNNEFRSGDKLDVSEIGIDDGEDKDDVSTFDDIDDFDSYTQTINNVTLKVNVYYISDEAKYSDNVINFKYDLNTKKDKTNIKLVKITSDNNIIFYYPTCNIGASKFLSLEEISR
jgi:type II secretory pathway pseudopilin PulG